MAVTLGLSLGRQQRVVGTLGNREVVATKLQRHHWEAALELADRTFPQESRKLDF